MSAAAEVTDKVVELRPADTLALFYSIDDEPKFAAKLCAEATLHAAVHSVLFCGKPEPGQAAESLEIARELATSGSWGFEDGWLELRKGMAPTIAFLAEKVKEARADMRCEGESRFKEMKRADEMTARYVTLAAALRGALGDNLDALAKALPAVKS